MLFNTLRKVVFGFNPPRFISQGESEGTPLHRAGGLYGATLHKLALDANGDSDGIQADPNTTQVQSPFKA